MYIPIDKNKIERDCGDFRSDDNWPRYCIFSKSCSGPIEQKMYADSSCGDGRARCLGICDEKKVPMLKVLHVQKPTRLKLVIFSQETKSEQVYALPEVDFDSELKKIFERFPDLRKMKMIIPADENKFRIVSPDRKGSTKNLEYDYDED